jgi:cell division protein FtsQ
MPVKNIQVKGELNFLDEDDIGLTVKNNIAGGYFTVDLKHVRELLLRDPWIKQVALRRQWPAGVSVFIEEKKPVAYWNDEGYISKTGDAFKPVSVNKALSLPELDGPEGQHVNVWRFMNVLYQEMAVLNYEIKRLQLDDRRAWQLEIVSNMNTRNTEAETVNLKDGINVRLGRFDTEKRMQRFVRILPALTAEMKQKGKKIKVIDMRYPNGFAVQMSEA